MDAKTLIRKAANRARWEYHDAMLSIIENYERFGDWRHGVDTAGEMPLEKLSIDSSSRLQGYPYGPMPMAIFNQIMKKLKIRYEDYVFIDLGSGKGRILLSASRYPFREVIGVEFARELHEAAEKNLQIYRRRHKGQRWRVEHGDAAEFRFPDENIVLFLFNPFGEPVLRKVLDNIETYVRDFGKSIYVVYSNAVHGAMLDASPNLLLREAFPMPRLFGLPAPPQYCPFGTRIYSGRR